MHTRTDLAIERYLDTEDGAGVRHSICRDGSLEISEVEILTADAAKRMGKEKGKYITLSDEALGDTVMDEEKRRALAEALAEKVEALLPIDGCVLVVGLGNRQITADALGSRTVEKMLVTRHMAENQSAPLADFRSVCAVSPGVLGITGIETAEMVRGVVEKVHPCAVIAVDALAAREAKRIGTVLQVTDTGICPGSGVGNHRVGLQKSTLGVPVIAVGVPMVVYASTIARDALSYLVEELALPGEEQEQAVDGMVGRVTEKCLGELVVTPRDVDELVGRVASVVALGINMALQKHLGAEDILFLTNDHI
ncbi:MAG: GPR endopeptidase [Clostridia bacterium]|nr:GPR endopeptidase [Clostridia bacterium]